MTTRRSWTGAATPLLVALVALTFSVAGPAHAQSKDPAALKLACVQASDKAQQLRVAGKLVAARDTLRTCVLDACPSVVREACAQWLGEVTASLPSIVIGAKDADGKDVLDLKVAVDGEPVAEPLGGRALPIDPGRHKMRYEKADGVVVEEDILVGEGTKNRPVSVVFPGPKTAAAASAAVAETPVAGPKGPSTGNTVGGVVFAALGAGSLATALALDLTTTSNINTLRGEACAKTATCSSSQVSGYQLDYDLAGVTLGVGVALVAVATWVFIGHPFGTPTTAAARTGESKPSIRVVPSPRGGGLLLTF